MRGQRISEPPSGERRADMAKKSRWRAGRDLSAMAVSTSASIARPAPAVLGASSSRRRRRGQSARDGFDSTVLPRWRRTQRPLPRFFGDRIRASTARPGSARRWSIVDAAAALRALELGHRPAAPSSKRAASSPRPRPPRRGRGSAANGGPPPRRTAERPSRPTAHPAGTWRGRRRPPQPCLSAEDLNKASRSRGRSCPLRLRLLLDGLGRLSCGFLQRGRARDQYLELRFRAAPRTQEARITRARARAPTIVRHDGAMASGSLPRSRATSTLPPARAFDLTYTGCAAQRRRRRTSNAFTDVRRRRGPPCPRGCPSSHRQEELAARARARARLRPCRLDLGKNTDVRTQPGMSRVLKLGVGRGL